MKDWMTNQSTPRVTIGIPTLNRPDLLVRAVQSVLAQDYANLEVVVCDNASTPPSREALTACLSDSRLKYVYFEERVGMVANWNRCFSLATGDLWLCLSDDDWMKPDAVKKMAARFTNASVGMAVCSRIVETEKGPLRSDLPQEGVVSGHTYILDRLRRHLGGCPAAEMFRADKVRQAGGYQEIGMAMDLLLELDTGSSSDIAYIQEPLIHYALHLANASVTRSVEYVQSHEALAKLSATRHNPVVASEVKRYCINAICGRMKSCAVNQDKPATQAAYLALTNLKLPPHKLRWLKLLDNASVQKTLHQLRSIKRSLKRNPSHE